MFLILKFDWSYNGLNNILIKFSPPEFHFGLKFYSTLGLARLTPNKFERGSNFGFDRHKQFKLSLGML